MPRSFRRSTAVRTTSDTPTEARTTGHLRDRRQAVVVACLCVGGPCVPPLVRSCLFKTCGVQERLILTHGLQNRTTTQTSKPWKSHGDTLTCPLFGSREPCHRLNYLVLDPLGGLDRHILPPLSPSQPVIAEKNGCWGKEPSRSSLRKLVAGKNTNIFVLKALGWCFPGISEFCQLRSGLGSSAPHRPALHRSTITRSNAAPCSALRCPAAALA